VGGTLQRPQPIPPTAPPFQPIIWLGPTYSLANVLGGNNPLTIDVNTGIMKGVPPVLGQFVVAVCLEEYDRSTKNLLSVVRRDFQYNVVNCMVPQATFEAPKELCVGSKLTLKQSTPGAKSVEWYLGEPGAEKLISKGDSVNLTFAAAGKNRITLYYEKGTACQSTFSAVIDAVAIDVISLPLAGQNSVVCRGSNFEVNIQNKQENRSLTYDWQTNGNLVSGQGSSLATFKIDAPTLITLNLSNALGCKSTLIFPVAIHSSIQSTINTGIQVCRDVPTVTNENFNKNLSYSWLPKNGLSNPNIGNPVITLNNSQIYSVNITNPETKCDTSISFSAIVKPFGADPGIDSLSTVCYNVGKQINPKFNNTLIYSWSPATGLSETTKGNPMVMLKGSMSYTVKIQNPASGCDTTISVRVEVSPMLPVVELDTTLDFCPGIPKKVNLPESSLVTYLWSPSTGLDNANVANPTFTLQNNQIYTVKITDPKTNCNLVWKVNAQVSPEAVISAGKDTTLCNYGPYTLKATSSLPLSFQWSRLPDFSNNLGNQATLKRDTLSRGENSFYFKATDAKGCLWRDTVVINAVPVEATMPNDYVVCKPVDLTTVTIKDNDPNQGLKNYSWFPVNSLTTKPNEGPNAIYKINATTLVNVNVENKYGCKKSLETQLELIDIKVNIATDKETLIKGNNEIANISVTGCTDCAYAWTPSTGLNATNTASVRATPQDTTIYKVVVSKKGCKEEKTIRINVDNVNCGEPNIFVPNAFTPNNDGNNDILKVRGRWISKLQFVVYNRWGQEMFTTTDLNNGWNGVFKGNEVAPDVYNYFLQVTCLDNKIFTKRGNTSLIK
jgi:gliding motility-associated-like protein